MNEPDLFILVKRAKEGDKEAMHQIILLYQPLIVKATTRAKHNDRGDLQQDITEKLIRAVLRYDINSIPNYSQFIELYSPK